MSQLSLFNSPGSRREVAPTRQSLPGAPHQPGSATSRAGAEAIAPKTEALRGHVAAACYAAGPEGLTIEQLAHAVTIRRGKVTKETTICGQVAGRDPLCGQWVTKSGRTRPNASGVAADVYVHRAFLERDWRGPTVEAAGD